MTGLAQVRGWRGETDTEEKLIHRIDSDLEYIATWSLGGDLLIICRTVVTVLQMPNAY
jgi:lipopolysaccharide/colanic/teichoic acid biosynthesis glycosyltransferase